MNILGDHLLTCDLRILENICSNLRIALANELSSIYFRRGKNYSISLLLPFDVRILTLLDYVSSWIVPVTDLKCW